ncbi:hypothetical protein TeGR_g13917, partial [Tetraparma gracilis]
MSSKLKAAKLQPAFDRLSSLTRRAPRAYHPAAPLPTERLLGSLEAGPFLAQLSAAWRDFLCALPASPPKASRVLRELDELRGAAAVQNTLMRGFLQSLKGALQAEGGGGGDPSEALAFMKRAACVPLDNQHSSARLVLLDQYVVNGLLQLVRSGAWPYKVRSEAIEVLTIPKAGQRLAVCLAHDSVINGMCALANELPTGDYQLTEDATAFLAMAHRRLTTAKGGKGAVAASRLLDAVLCPALQQGLTKLPDAEDVFDAIRDVWVENAVAQERAWAAASAGSLE